MQLKKYIHKLARSMGFDFYALKDKFKSEEVKLRWLKSKNIKTVLDIGANEGQFAKMARNILPNAKIISFEPIEECFNKLILNLKNDNNFQAFKVAIGETESDSEIYVNDYSPSSSLLEIDDLHVKNFSNTAKTHKEQIKIKPLDSYDDLNLAKPLLVKIDTQGYESKVIDGATKVLGKADIILIELTYKQLYKEQNLFHDIYSKLYKIGFEYHGNYENLFSPTDGSALQSDGIFIKRQFNNK